MEGTLTIQKWLLMKVKAESVKARITDDHFAGLIYGILKKIKL